jgi:hypothetical protein
MVRSMQERVGKSRFLGYAIGMTISGVLTQTAAQILNFSDYGLVSQAPGTCG